MFLFLLLLNVSRLYADFPWRAEDVLHWSRSSPRRPLDSTQSLEGNHSPGTGCWRHYQCLVGVYSLPDEAYCPPELLLLPMILPEDGVT